MKEKEILMKLGDSPLSTSFMKLMGKDLEKIWDQAHYLQNSVCKVQTVDQQEDQTWL